MMTVRGARWESRSRLSENAIHRPATAGVGAGASQVGDQWGVSTAGFLQGVRKDGQAVESLLVVNALSQSGDQAVFPVLPGTVQDLGSEGWVAE
jgi:hypothetical protein